MQRAVVAVPWANGYVYRIRQELERLMPRAILLNQGVSGARIDIVNKEVRNN
jgi:hypothetical protein